MIGGIAGGLEYNAVALGEVSFAGVGQNRSLSFLYTPGGQKDTLLESALLDTYGIEARKHPPRLIFCDGSEIAMIRKNGLFYVWVEFNGLGSRKRWWRTGSSLPPIPPMPAWLAWSAPGAGASALGPQPVQTAGLSAVG